MRTECAVVGTESVCVCVCETSVDGKKKKKTHRSGGCIYSQQGHIAVVRSVVLKSRFSYIFKGLLNVSMERE